MIGTILIKITQFEKTEVLVKVFLALKNLKINSTLDHLYCASSSFVMGDRIFLAFKQMNLNETQRGHI